jgi:hypothetical protein
VIEFSLGANPFLHELFGAVNVPVQGIVAPPTASGFGCDPVPEVVERYTIGAASVSDATKGAVH